MDLNLPDIPTCDECNRPRGWGTDHVGAGNCKTHDVQAMVETVNSITLTPTADSNPVSPTARSYAKSITDSRLRQLVVENEQAMSDTGDGMLDPEIALLRAMIALLADGIGIVITFDPESGETEIKQGYYGLNAQARELSRTIKTLTDTQRAKYQVMMQMRETIPRSEVRRLIEMIQVVLMKHPRDSCPECGGHIGILSSVLDELETLPSF